MIIQMGLLGPMIPLKFKGNKIIGKIIINKHCIVGANSVILPNVTFNEGCCSESTLIS